jgi:hypothetical protein
MKNYFTSIERVDSQFFGTVHDATSNQAVYRTAGYNSHSDAIADVNAFLQNTSGETIPQQSITNTTTYQAPVTETAPAPEFTPPKRCCGR